MLVICIMTKLAFHLYAGALVLHGLLGWSVMPTVAFMGCVVAWWPLLAGLPRWHTLTRFRRQS